MRLLSLLLIISIVSCTEKKTAGQEESRNYYLSSAGSDDNDGSKDHPWKTISKLNSVKLQAGDTIFFKGGETFTGNIRLDSFNAGSQSQPLVITSWGTAKAVINGQNSSALTMYTSSYITIYNINFTGAGRKEGNTKDGVAVMYSHHIVLDDVEINGFQKAGLLVYESSDIIVTRIHAHENGFAGISIDGGYQKRNAQRIHISYSRAEDNPGDPTNLTNHSGNGILTGNSKNVLIEYCTATNNGWDMPRKGNGPVGIWCYESDSVTIQHCISYRNKTSKGGADGGGFDLDGGVTNSVIQYCLSYENEGSGFGIFQYAGAANWNNNTIRFSISENDGTVSPAGAGVFIWNSSGDTAQFKNCFFYNNAVYNARAAAISYEAQSKNAGFRFYNNIFVAKDSLVIGKETNSTYQGNNWYSLESGFNIGGIKDFTTWSATYNKEKLNGATVGLNINPLFTNAGNSVIVLPSQLNTFNSYQVPGNSILRTGGLNLQQLFGITTGGKAFNQGAAPEKGIGACF